MSARVESVTPPQGGPSVDCVLFLYVAPAGLAFAACVHAPSDLDRDLVASQAVREFIDLKQEDRACGRFRVCPVTLDQWHYMRRAIGWCGEDPDHDAKLNPALLYRGEGWHDEDCARVWEKLDNVFDLVHSIRKGL